MSRTSWAALIALVAVCLATFAGVPSAAAARYTPPPLTGHVVDATNTLSAEQIAALDRKLTAFREQRGFAVVAFVVPTLDGLPIEDVAYDTFNTWGVGAQDKDNGVLLVIAPNERRVRIETGKGVGGELTDLESAEILRTYVSPAMRRGDLFAAVDGGTDAIAKALADELPVDKSAPSERGQEQPKPSPLRMWMLLAGLVVVGLLSLVSPTFRVILFGILQALLFMRGGGGGRGGGSFGGYSGGGGRSGGGGASDSY
ncbi:MAG: TPM domain-containing protein [Polyangiaceae bacterium]|nr:TPM domain-containing protein [Polyangiaceae bacterium]